MALIVCPECGKEISDSAESCPFCGKPLKSTRAKLLSEDAVIAGRRQLSLFAPIFWFIIFIVLFVISLIFVPDSPVIRIIDYILTFGLLGPILAFLLAIISRARNNSIDKPVIIYRSASDSFEVLHLNNKLVTIKRTAVTRIENDVATIIYWKDSIGKINKVKAAYCDDPISIKNVMNKYLEFK